MGRSSKKGPYVDEALFNAVERRRLSGVTAPIKVWNRACTIVPEFVGQSFDIHNGKVFIRLFVSEDMVGHKLGEFAPTRNFRQHSTRSVKK